MKKENINRGKIVKIRLKKEIIFNSESIKEAIIEIDHINYGLDTKTNRLKTKARSSFTIRDIEKFICLLDGEKLVPEKYRDTSSIFQIRIDCPIEGKFFGKEFVMIFETDYKKQELIYTVTLFPNWKTGE